MVRPAEDRDERPSNRTREADVEEKLVARLVADNVEVILISVPRALAFAAREQGISAVMSGICPETTIEEIVVNASPCRYPREGCDGVMTPLVVETQPLQPGDLGSA